MIITADGKIKTNKGEGANNSIKFIPSFKIYLTKEASGNWVLFETLNYPVHEQGITTVSYNATQNLCEVKGRTLWACFQARCGCFHKTIFENT
jgi:hypothetical protein